MVNQISTFELGGYFYTNDAIDFTLGDASWGFAFATIMDINGVNTIHDITLHKYHI